MILVFSKDRPMQVELLLRSLHIRCQDMKAVDEFKTVLYKASTPEIDEMYKTVAKEYPLFDFVPETDFKSQVLEQLRFSKFVMFLVDDTIFIQNFTHADLYENLEDNNALLGISLRLGLNCVHCYAMNQITAAPFGTMEVGEKLYFNWTMGQLDWGYPLEVSSSIYRTEDIRNLLNGVDFKNPNDLEWALDIRKNFFKRSRPLLASFKFSRAFSVPANKVNPENRNLSGNDPEYSVEALLQKFREGKRICYNKNLAILNFGVHMEYPYEFC